MKVRLNFNYHSAAAWGTLLTAVVSGGVSILAACGVAVKQTDTTSLYTAITAILSLLSALGILTTSTDKKGDNNVQK